MAIRCARCDKPVHEQAVICPHCGGETGVPPDANAAAELAVASAELVSAIPPQLSFAPSSRHPFSGYDVASGGIVAAGLAAVGAAAQAAIGALVAAPEHEEPVPFAIARERRGASAEPATAPQEDRAETDAEAAPAEAPRYLK